ncbi:hypothetical protein B0H14DRAFT_332227 [Mycena olivaceomarginata]|nr:hypothetical protein B0H14DRAFT_332227 [Mycena olivaceomarginata]
MGPPQTPIPSRVVLKDLNAFPPFGVDTSPFNYAPARTNEFRVAADAKFRDDDQKHAFLSQNAPKEKRQGGKSKKKEDSPSAVATDNSTSTRAQYSGDDLILITREVVNVNPFIAAYGQKGVSWQQIADNLEERGFRHKITAATVQHKAEALISYKKDPNGKNKNLAKVIGEGTSASIIIGALLERMETQYDESKDKSDDAKAKLKAKQDADRVGGEAIRRASMQTMRKRARSPSISDDDDAPTDTEAPTVDKSTDSRAVSESPTADKSPGSRAISETPIEPVANALSASSSLDILDSDDEKTKAKKKSKRRRTMDRRTSSLAGTDKLAALLKEEITSLLRDLVNIAEKEL